MKNPPGNTPMPPTHTHHPPPPPSPAEKIPREIVHPEKNPLGGIPPLTRNNTTAKWTLENPTIKILSLHVRFPNHYLPKECITFDMSDHHILSQSERSAIFVSFVAEFFLTQCIFFRTVQIAISLFFVR